MSKLWPYGTPGIPDRLFTRGEVPMTKEEVRAVTLAKARLTAEHIVWDIGAGTGSITVEAALAASGGRVYAVEQNMAGVQLIEENIRRFDVGNVTVCPGAAPGVLADLPAPDRVFIGGSGGKLAEIFRAVHDQLRPQGRIVVNAITLDTLNEALGFFDYEGYTDIDVVQVQVNHLAKKGRCTMMLGQNPVFIISANKGESTA
ncbi:precorrin-6Y C5,15-methyltransferase (decarboxylating) subunit CbiT [bacterium]|nr:MAG: precorrin-6Y C5,15-methyltransferase (decarboxylating) subunit CbiT [bacterium]